MREIKFRAWLIGSERMLKDVGFDGSSSVANEVVEYMQFTGLKDKNGVDIYEGDIVEVDGKYDNSKAIGFVAWYDSHSGFSIDFQNDGLLGALDQRLEVIGNVYENPELLEDAEA